MVRDLLWKNNKFQYKVEIILHNPNPDNIKKNIVYVVGDKKYAKWAYLRCPSGCNDIIMLSLNKRNFPSWSVKQDKLGRATISPSIHKLDGCKSHFFIKKGKLIWAHSF
jgi:hypothetical protein